MWILIEYATAQKRNSTEYQSVRAQFQFDCLTKNYREIYFTEHVGLNQEKGKVVNVYNDPTVAWSPAPPRTVIDRMLEYACEDSVNYQSLSPYGTGFAPGSKEDLQIRLEWAKKDPCYAHGFSPDSVEFLELKKYRVTQAGPNGQVTSCKSR